MKITIEKDCRIKNDQYSAMFNEILQALDTLEVSGSLIEHIGVMGVDDGHGSWQLVLTITFVNPPSSFDMRKWKDQAYLDTGISGCRLKKIISDKTKSFIEARIAEANQNSTNLELYRVVVGPLN